MKNDTAVANIIWSQISLNTKMCLAASKPVAASDYELRFFVRVDNQRRYISVFLNGKDLYDCEQVLCRGSKVTAKFRAEDVYCDELDEVVYRLGSTRYPAKGFLEEVGIKRINEPR